MSARVQRRGGILLIDKDSGPSSHDVVRQLRKIYSTRAVGHCGTLDPLASGLLVVMFDQSTRLASYATDADKIYRCTCRLGLRSDTDDSEGQIIARADSAQISDAQIEAALQKLRGPIMQVPPQFSAIKIDGQRAYALARQGQKVDLKARPITVHQLDLIERQQDQLVLDVHISKGGYIRSLVRDLGHSLGCGAFMTALRRTRSGHFSIGQALRVDALGDDPRALLRSPCDAFVPEARVELDKKTARSLWQTGRAAFSGPWPDLHEPWLACSVDDVVAVVVRGDGDELRVKRGFPAPE